MKLPAALAVWLLFQQVPFSQNPPVPLRSGAKWGLADPSDGREIMPPTLDSIGLFRDDDGDFCPLAVAKKGGQFGLVDRWGEVVLPFDTAAFMEIGQMVCGFWWIERFAFGATSYEQEAERQGGISGEDAIRPAAYFDSLGNRLGRGLVFEDHIPEGDEGMYYDPSELEDDPQKLFLEDCPIVAAKKDGKRGTFDLSKDSLLYFEEDRPASPARFQLDYSQGFSKDRFLARDTATGLFGYLDWAGNVAVPFEFTEAKPFSRGGLAKAKRADNLWRIIDRNGRDSLLLGPEPIAFRGPDSAFWTKSGSDGLFRKNGAAGGNPIETMGIDRLPDKTRLGSHDFWLAKRNKRAGLLNLDGSAALPFEFDVVRPLGGNYWWPDSAQRTHYFTVVKSGRQWLFDSRTMAPVRPKLLSGSGLSMPEEVWESSFDLLEPLLGDSLFIIGLGERQIDVLNIRTGRRWFQKTGQSNASMITRPNRQGADQHIVVFYGSSSNTACFTPDGRPWWEPSLSDRFTPGFGIWNQSYDEKTGLTAILDSAERAICSLRVPFEGQGNQLDIVENKGGRMHPFVVMTTSPEGKSAVFSLAGETLSPPWIYKATVSHDLIFAEMWQKQGVFRLDNGREVLPCAFSSIDWKDGQLVAIDLDGTEIHFDLNGKKVFSFEKGVASYWRPSEGLQPIRSGRREGFMDENRRPIFWLRAGQSASGFSGGLAVVSTCEGGKSDQFFIDKKGNEAPLGHFRQASPFEDGRAVVLTKAGDWQVIDSTGRVLLSQPSADDGGIWRGEGGLFSAYSNTWKSLFDRDGRLLLDAINGYSTRGDTIFFARRGEFGCRLPSGKEVGVPTRFFKTTTTTSFGEIVQVGIANGGEGLRGPDGRWLVEPRWGRRIEARAELGPFAIVTDEETGRRTSSTIDLRTGQKAPVGPFDDWFPIEGVGAWLARSDEQGNCAAAMLVDESFQKIRELPCNWRIQMDAAASCFSVFEGDTFLGYMARNGKPLFGD